MPQSLVKNYMHLVWSTKNREPLILPSIEPALHQKLGLLCRNLECARLKIGGYTDHVQVLMLLSKKITVVKLMEELKSKASKWIKAEGEAFENFYWQRGYGGFSVSPGQVPILENYLQNQHTHHQTQTYKDEFRGYLHEYEVAYNEQHVWD